jgi:hypothetical protein
LPPDDRLDEPPEEPRDDPREEPPEEPREEPPEGLLTGFDRELLLRVELFEPDERPLSLLRCGAADGRERSVDFDRVDDPELPERLSGGVYRSLARVVPPSRDGRDWLRARDASRSRALRSKRRSIPLPVRLAPRSNVRVLRAAAGARSRVPPDVLVRTPVP